MMHHRSTATAAAALAIALCASLPARAQTARLGGLPASAQVVTNEQDAAALAALNAANAVISAALTNEAALRVEGDAAGLAAVNATNAVLSAAITNEAALRAAGDAAGLAAVNATNAVLSAAITNEAALRAAHIVRTDNPHGVTAAQIGALTNELDLAALRTYHYGSPDIVESPAEWFVKSGTEITYFYYVPGREDVVIPWQINGSPILSLSRAFRTGPYECHPVTQVRLPKSVTAIQDEAFAFCYSLTNIVIPAARTVGIYAFTETFALTSIRWQSDAPEFASEENLFASPPASVVNYVDNPVATGWGATLGGMPVVRPTLSAESIRLAIELHTDSFTNVVWKSVWSNGWHWLVAYTNTPGGGE